jgi:exodeoxyribonuclease VII small subunit
MQSSSPQAGGQPDSDLQVPNLSFEDAYTRLEETVRALESGELTLEAATDLYEEGMRLVRLCGGLLSEAELKMTKLREVHTTGPVDEPLFPDEE